MCKEFVNIALCAPASSPFLSFTCGKLHMVADKRETCQQSCGNCPCFFGTCGEVERVVATAGIDFSDLKKVRCLACTLREDNVGDRRTSEQLLESPLLARKAVNSSDRMEEFRMTLKELWGGKSTCPFHVADDNILANDDDTHSTTANLLSTKSAEAKAMADNLHQHTATSSERRAEMNAAFLEDTPIESPAKSNDAISGGPETAASKSETNNDHNNNGQEVDVDGLKMNVGLTCSRWANAEPSKPLVPKTKPSSPKQRIVHVAAKVDRAAIAKTMPQLASLKDFLKGY